MKDRVLRDFTEDDLNLVTNTYHNWQIGEGYEDVAGFVKTVRLEQIQKHDHVLTPGRYVGATNAEEDIELFGAKMVRLAAQLKGQFEESERLKADIKNNLAGLGYEC
jgi:type I restriction enzyme M protein